MHNFEWATIPWREHTRWWFSTAEGQADATTELEEYIAWEQLADVFTAR